MRTLRRDRQSLQGLGVRSLSLFGSVAKGTAKDDSDVDLLADLDPMNIVRLVEIQDRLRGSLQREIDLVNRKYIKPALKAAIERSEVRVF